MLNMLWLDKVAGVVKYLAIYLIFIGAYTGAGIGKLANPTPPGIAKNLNHLHMLFASATG